MAADFPSEFTVNVSRVDNVEDPIIELIPGVLDETTEEPVWSGPLKFITAQTATHRCPVCGYEGIGVSVSYGYGTVSSPKLCERCWYEKMIAGIPEMVPIEYERVEISQETLQSYAAMAHTDAPDHDVPELRRFRVFPDCPCSVCTTAREHEAESKLVNDAFRESAERSKQLDADGGPGDR